MIVILSDDTNQTVGKRVANSLAAYQQEIEYISLNDKNILPCLGCGSCSSVTFGHCVRVDDVAGIVAQVAKADCWLLISPIRFGSYSSLARSVMERLSVLGDPRYYVRDGEIVKGMTTKGPFYGIGISNNATDLEQDTFTFLHQEHLKIMNCPGQVFVLEHDAPEEKIVGVVKELFYA